MNPSEAPNVFDCTNIQEDYQYNECTNNGNVPLVLQPLVAANDFFALKNASSLEWLNCTD